MGPYDLHQMQQDGGDFADPDDQPDDLMELLLLDFAASGYGRHALTEAPPVVREAILKFLDHARGYLRANPPAGQGMVEGAPALVLRDGTQVPFVPPTGQPMQRESAAFAVTQPRERRMKGMRGGEAVTIGITGRDRPRR